MFKTTLLASINSLFKMKSFFVITLVLFSCLCLVGVTQAVAVSKEGTQEEVAPVHGKIGIEDGRIGTSSLSASSCWDINHCVARSRLNQPEEGALRGAWSASWNDVNQWIQVDLNANFEVTGVITQGRNYSYEDWVTSYQISYSIDGQDWTMVEDYEEGPKIFPGNSDRDSLVENGISPPVTARFIRLHPVTWHRHISLRWELIGQGPVTFAPVPGKIGIEDGRIGTSSLSASSCWDINHCVARSRLNQPEEGALRGAWSASRNDVNQWIQVDLSATFEVTGVITQGRNYSYEDWVTSYQISYSIDGQDWTMVEDYEEGPKIFPGNSDRDSLVENGISPPLTARFIRLHPVTWHRHISLRWELIGQGPVTSQETPTSHSDETNPTESRGDAVVRPVGNMTSLPGVIYIRWGNDVCPEDAELIYSGSIGGAHFTQTGSGSNYLCMPDEPIYDEVETSEHADRALLYSSEYQVSGGPSRVQPMHDHTPTCAVCRAPSGRTSKLMIPARNVCPSQEWRLEYAGYLMAERYTHKRSEFVCVDREMVPKAGTLGNQDGVLLYMTEVRCQVGDGLDCGPYIDGYEITCAVCTI
eukprot:XP_011664509.1 PREDICTED: LOW QUALITY PROTEIN: lactadherin [Strongylocentrotus purpuratus]